MSLIGKFNYSWLYKGDEIYEYSLEEKKENLVHIIKNTQILGATFEKQKKYFCADFMTDDMADDWDSFAFFAINLNNQKVISNQTFQTINKINNNFQIVSYKQPKYEETIWTLEGLENHPFWEEQRKLAKELLVMLEEDLKRVEKQ